MDLLVSCWFAETGGTSTQTSSGLLARGTHELQTYFCSLIMPLLLAGLCKMFCQRQLISYNCHRHQGLDAKPIIVSVMFFAKHQPGFLFPMSCSKIMSRKWFTILEPAAMPQPQLSTALCQPPSDGWRQPNQRKFQWETSQAKYECK